MDQSSLHNVLFAEAAAVHASRYIRRRTEPTIICPLAHGALEASVYFHPSITVVLQAVLAVNALVWPRAFRPTSCPAPARTSGQGGPPGEPCVRASGQTGTPTATAPSGEATATLILRRSATCSGVRTCPGGGSARRLGVVHNDTPQCSGVWK